MDNFKKKYNDLVEAVKQLQKANPSDEGIQNWVNDNVPELAGSEGERIRKAIHIYLDWLDGRKDYAPRGEYSIRDMISWLEKQGEQKSYGQREECLDCQFNYAGECKGSCQMKRSERKPADKVELLDEFAGLTDFERTLADICIGWIGEEPGWKQYIKDNAYVLLQIAVEKFNSVQDAPFERKAAWSEEDEKWMKYFNEMLDYNFRNFTKFEPDAVGAYNWLETIKQRIGG